jgi:glycosyltransferase involved in cell wall biosynthesis
MKIVFLSRYQNNIQRGAENFVTEITRKLKGDFEIEIYSGRDSDDFRKIANGNFDLVIPINGRMQSLKASLGRFLSGYKTLITGHSGIGRDDLWNLSITRPNLFVALTDKMFNWANTWGFGLNIVKIPDGVDVSKFTPVGEKIDFGLPKPIILSVGALVWYKHHDKVIEAVSHIKKGSLVVVGRGPDKKQLEKLGKRKLGDRFKILEADFLQMPKIYRSANVFTLPSWDREAFGMVYLEAMACGLPVIAPNDSSRQEIVGDGGILVDVDNVGEYSSALEASLNISWSKKPREQSEKFSWEFVANQYKINIQRLLSTK